MFFFIATILIAELIIASFLICQINILDNKVLGLIKQTDAYKPQIARALTQLKETVSKIVLGVHKLVEYAKRRRQEYSIAIIQNILMYLLLFTLKGKSKKYVSLMQLAVVLKECWERTPAVL